ncbi:type 2 periplasmic-binding domain-containing protein [Lederbergia lenta]|uniref:Sugar ABC transporter substrate-binding protein n=1 Tax=Lederbergia lenta TaxID=1467 RepID=A0A2X4WHG8_LEDLE|nr:extracellular solute-binding protein [Lederbergia lenta]MEC2323051.1 extracellular solute-binding protein [Lederbergia lenta]SQI62581.1 sugar ABC transporter substrate-binding protein [Lederbergia lenta]
MQKRFIALTIVLLLLLGACSSKKEEAGAKEDVDSDEKVTLSAFGIKAPAATTDYDEMPFLKELADNVNVDIKWTTATTQTSTEQINLMFASDDLPDIFYSAWSLGGSDIVKYGSTGQLVALDDLIEEHAPNIKELFEKRPDLKKMITAPDGHIYALPQYDESKASKSNDAFFINKKWLDQLDLPIPTTTEEFHETLKAFKDNDMNENGKKDEIPFSFTFENQIRGPHSMSGAFGVVGRHIGVKDGNVYYAPAQPKYREYVKYMHDLYKDGLIDPEAFTHDVQVYDSKIKSSTPILGALFSWSNFSSFGKVDTDYVAIPPLKGPEGDQMWNANAGGLSMSGFSITSANKNPIRSIQWVDQMFDEETGIQVSLGPLGENIKKEDDGTITILEAPEGMSYEEFRHKTTPGSYGVYANLEETNDKVNKSPGQIEKEEYAEMYAPFQPEEIYPNVLYSVEDGDRLSILSTDIDNYMNETIPKFIINGDVDAQWDAYVKQLEKMGLAELLEIYQKYYDEFK